MLYNIILYFNFNRYNYFKVILKVMKPDDE